MKKTVIVILFYLVLVMAEDKTKLGTKQKRHLPLEPPPPPIDSFSSIGNIGYQSYPTYLSHTQAHIKPNYYPVSVPSPIYGPVPTAINTGFGSYVPQTPNYHLTNKPNLNSRPNLYLPPGNNKKPWNNQFSFTSVGSVGSVGLVGSQPQPIYNFDHNKPYNHIQTKPDSYLPVPDDLNTNYKPIYWGNKFEQQIPQISSVFQQNSIGNGYVPSSHGGLYPHQGYNTYSPYWKW